MYLYIYYDMFSVANFCRKSGSLEIFYNIYKDAQL